LDSSCRWTFLNTMKERRKFSSLVSLPSFGIVAIGGEAISGTRHSTVSALQSPDLEWQRMPYLNIMVSRHCSVSIASREIFVIGGFMDDQPFSNKVVKINLVTLEAFTLISRMRMGRQLHSCAVVDSKKIIVAGGRNHQGLLSSVEVFNVVTSTWTAPKHLEQPRATGYGQLLRVNGEIICPYVILYTGIYLLCSTR